ncbi:TPA: hypothetical protein NIC78_005867 [Pseudomonas aeruginosa]|uniref:hypothetical protein n=1 Tax=Pseudomonas aeruginosa TaxID=287 RepID=UPI0009A523A6|nr:hypothetical protein [Pseudomonas aeruginosa]EKX5158560.1 hypothetical protein [Pseudomonas aeruginosa]EMC2594278.1 hypothetical protein [Pseudomonas aeruginosa]RPZ97965.1 hypothetical protein IPC509_28115 [Pseudomonas aeruginosa]RQB98612.1 hypothetical protein IPC389_27165 [Pseudomonas aeruginosa]TEH77720.1 hypothetical protein IPC1315_23405 [Pseudomonas aeruginosa]
MKRMLLALALAASPALAEESKPIATQVGDAIRPAAEAYGKGMQKLVNELFAGSKGPMGEAARANLKAQDQREREANRGVRHTTKECIKPGNIIDDDVKECVAGLRVRNWCY